MKRISLRLVVAFSIVAVLLTGCGQPAAPAPTAAPAKTTEPAAPAAAAPTAAPAAAAPTAAPAKNLDWPQKGKTITLIVPTSAGGGAMDIGARLLADALQKDLGVNVVVENKPGGAYVVGLTAAVQAKPDGYTFGYSGQPTIALTYLNPDLHTTYTAKDFQPVASHHVDPFAVAVTADSPYKSMKDLIDAAKAKPLGIRFATAGQLGPSHLVGISLEQQAGVKFTYVHFDSVTAASTAMLGGNADVQINSVAGFLSMVKNGQLRIIGIADSVENPTYPGVKTVEEQGYGKVYMGMRRGLFAPAGTPMDIVDAMSAAVGRAVKNPDHIKKMTDAAIELSYMDRPTFEAYWKTMDDTARSLLEAAKLQQK